MIPSSQQLYTLLRHLRHIILTRRHVPRQHHRQRSRHCGKSCRSSSYPIQRCMYRPRKKPRNTNVYANTFPSWRTAVSRYSRPNIGVLPLIKRSAPPTLTSSPASTGPLPSSYATMKSLSAAQWIPSARRPRRASTASTPRLMLRHLVQFLALTWRRNVLRLIMECRVSILTRLL